MDPSELANMTPEQLANTPVRPPPPGITPNLANPSSDGDVLVIIGSVMIGIMLVIASLRFYVKFFMRRKPSPDDWTTLVAVLGTIAYFVICMFAVKKAKFGTHMWDLSIAHMMSKKFIITAFFSNWVTAIVWAFAKTSFFLMYLQLFKPFNWLRYAVYFGLFINWGFYISVIAATLYFTAPAPGQSWQDSFSSNRYRRSLNTTIPIAAGSLVLDIYIFILPVACIWPLNMTMNKKFGVLAVFATGLAACVASSLSIYFKDHLDHHQDDYTYYTLPVLLMALVEMCVGISASCMPPLTHLFKHGNLQWSKVSSVILRPFQSLHSGSWKGSNNSRGSGGSGWSEGALKKNNYTNMKVANKNEHELSHVKSIRTFIRGGRTPDGDDDDGIHLKYGISQDVEFSREVTPTARSAV
ncbi:hypothetical protein ASPWEDRAFT_42662 [Aspergillus wentii DTO 134E9]|uniref:Rhodopsin domain-containing protein n=1 Tax=Aspergillus wentii DTO 134E9 TaxID=1073089 RepID=A0A1L9RCK5_ASPWE|nr:uncharacterized protein ASPWEDRAFT_42662 [Aspergillus wentii DTO 134E9]KAI9924228.1 hypothetical protein MW887_007178 [Aspergillus wentii]OJJ32644.1 hypothetical protein ASPWEDRAFT_42662 [Aspergillus wentii DTO 134E9]